MNAQTFDTARGYTRVAYVHLTLHLVSGEQQQFVQTDPDAAQNLLDHLRPERIFAQKQFMIAGDDTVSLLPTEKVERVDLRTTTLPEWPHHDEFAAVTEISGETFRRIQSREPLPPPPLVLGRPMPPAPPAEIAVGVSMPSGATTYMSIRTKLPARTSGPVLRPTADDTRLHLQHLCTRPVLFGNLEDEQGVFLLNPSAAVRFTLAPPPPQTLAGAWEMQQYRA
jgi:hypothetical protein